MWMKAVMACWYNILAFAWRDWLIWKTMARIDDIPVEIQSWQLPVQVISIIIQYNSADTNDHAELWISGP
jgi:hypothetical protein